MRGLSTLLLAHPRAALHQSILITLLAALIYVPLLGSSGFAYSEFQRVLPGWTMLDKGDWLLPHLFEQPYLRKPPGMPWAVAAFSAVLGQNEWAARLVSVFSIIASGLICRCFAARWWDHSAGLTAGLAFILLPLWWYPGRSAEIEALHTMLCLASTLLILDVSLMPAAPRRWGRALLGGLTLGAMILTKGPAGLPATLAALVALCLTARSLRPLLSPAIVLAILLGMAIPAIYAVLLWHRLQTIEGPVVLQSPTEFSWKLSRIADIMLLPVSSLASALPAALGVLFTFLPRVNDAERADANPLALRAGRIIALTILLTLSVYFIAGVSSNRYVAPALALTPMAAAFALRRLQLFHPWHSRAAGTIPAIAAVMLLIAGMISAPMSFIRRAERTSGRPVGEALGRVLAQYAQPGDELWGTKLMDHRGEIPYAARAVARAEGRDIRVRWMVATPDTPQPLPPPGSFLALLNRKDDPEFDEDALYRASGLLEGLSPIFEGQAHKFTFRVYRMPPAP